MIQSVWAVLFFVLINVQAFALSNFIDVYPPIQQTIVDSGLFMGDRHRDFIGDAVAFLSDGSEWKIHPKQRDIFATWNAGDPVHIAVRTSFYWFKREHKFSLCNGVTQESIPVMIVRHKATPLKIVATDLYHKSTKSIYSYYTTHTVDENGNRKPVTLSRYEGEKPTDFRKVLVLSDGSCWVIKDNLNTFLLGMEVYVGAQGTPGEYYDFILISGTEREAIWTWARPQNV
jgi:hypothetical protein